MHRPIYWLSATRTWLTFLLLISFSLSAPTLAQTKRALLIGLGQQQDTAWDKINGDKDVPYVRSLLKDAGYRHIATLVNSQATKAGIVKAFMRLAAACRKGDVVYVHYSGHGQQMTDRHNDERDGLDECWIPYDARRKASRTYHGERHLTDDEVNVYLNAIRRRIGDSGRLLVVLDACHSGDATREDEDQYCVRGVEDTLVVDEPSTRGAEEAFEAMKAFFTGERVVNPKAVPLPERWITISACRSNQKNTEMRNPPMGKLTFALCQEIRRGERVNNEELMRRIRRTVCGKTRGSSQYPELSGEDKNRYYITDILSK